MSKSLLGEIFDIHGGGIDLQFPHHENEIAQSCCANESGRFANIWMHNEMLQVEGKKMSKSLGNFFTVRDLLDQGVPGEVIRFVYLQTHYSKPMDWTADKAAQAEATLRKWRALVDGVAATSPADTVVAALAADVNTAGAIAELHRLAGEASACFHLRFSPAKEDREIFERSAGVFLASARLMGVLQPEMGAWVDTGVDLSIYADHLKVLRTKAMAAKDFSAVDALKTALTAAGVEVRMSKAGVELLPGPGFNPDNLPVI